MVKSDGSDSPIFQKGVTNPFPLNNIAPEDSGSHGPMAHLVPWFTRIYWYLPNGVYLFTNDLPMVFHDIYFFTNVKPC